MANNVLADREKRIVALQTENDEQKGMIATMQPKAEYFDALVDRNLLTGFRETAKDLHWKEGEFREFLLGRKYLYRDRKNRLQPYAAHVDNGLFVLKECMSNKNNWAGTQIMFTPKARETFRLLKKTEGTAS